MSKSTDIVKGSDTNLEKISNLQELIPEVDVYENEDEILLHAEMPGVLKEDITVNIDNGRLSISGIRKMKHDGSASWEEFGEARYQRVFSVPQSIDTGGVNAELKLGVLKLHLPKSESAKPRKIEIKSS